MTEVECPLRQNGVHRNFVACIDLQQGQQFGSQQHCQAEALKWPDDPVLQRVNGGSPIFLHLDQAPISPLEKALQERAQARKTKEWER